MRIREFSWEVKVAMGLGLSSLVLYVVHYACFRDLQSIWVSGLTNLAFQPLSVLVVTLIINRLLSIRERAMRRDKMRMLTSVFFSTLGNKLIEFLFNCDSNVRQQVNSAERQVGKNVRRISHILAKNHHEVRVQHADLETLKALLTRKMDILLRLLENPSLHEHESFSELLRAVIHLTEELSLKDDFWNASDSDLKHLTADINRCYGLLVREWDDYLNYLQGTYPYLFSLVVRTNPLCGCHGEPARGKKFEREEADLPRLFTSLGEHTTL